MSTWMPPGTRLDQSLRPSSCPTPPYAWVNNRRPGPEISPPRMQKYGANPTSYHYQRCMQIAAIRQKVAGSLGARHSRVDSNGHGHSLKSFLRSEVGCAKIRSSGLASGPSRTEHAHHCPTITNHDFSRGNYPILCVWGTHMVDDLQAHR